MKTHVCLTGVIVALLSLGHAAVRGQEPTIPPPANAFQLPPPTANDGGLPPIPDASPTARPATHGNEPFDGGLRPEAGQPGAGGPPVYGPGITDWIAYPRSCNCCGPVGKHGPIGSEVYGRTGISFLSGGGLVGDNGRPGFAIGGGLRTLFFNKPDAAWVIDFGLLSSWNDIMNSPPAQLRNVDVLTAGQGNQQQRVNTPSVIVIASSVHYILATATIGREHYLWGGPDCGCDSKCRVGWDFGGSWGSSKMIAMPTNLQQGQALRHRKDAVGGFLVALHGDVEYPTGCCILFLGGRVEYGAIWSDILQSQNDTNVQMINVLFQAGLRF